MPAPAAKFVWKLARRHAWGTPIPADQLVRLATGSEDHDEMADILNGEVLEPSFVAHSSDGIFIPNGKDTHVEAANRLRDRTALNELTIKATLSRLPRNWPDDN